MCVIVEKLWKLAGEIYVFYCMIRQVEVFAIWSAVIYIFRINISHVIPEAVVNILCIEIQALIVGKTHL